MGDDRLGYGFWARMPRWVLLSAPVAWIGRIGAGVNAAREKALSDSLIDRAGGVGQSALVLRHLDGLANGHRKIGGGGA